MSDVNNDGYGENDAYNCGTTKSGDFSDDNYNQGMDDELDQDAIDPGTINHNKVDLENDFESGNEDYDLDNDADSANNDDDRNANTGQDSEDEFSSDYPLYHGVPISYREY